MIPIIGTGFGVVKEGVIPSVVVRNNTLPRLEPVAMLMGEATVFTLVSV
jgi:hypothetical protein